MTQMQRVTGRSTAVFTDDDGLTKCVYHTTPVAAFNRRRIVLDTGGYRTCTTKTRMNQFSNQFQLGYQVYQKDFDWFITFDGKTIPFDEQRVELLR